MELLKFITCGSVDDGKSTLIGHMLYDAKLIFADQEKSLELDSKVGSREGEIDYSLLLDGLMAEREQGITIDVAYRYFTTTKRSFIVADCPGHEQYTRNMAVGASFAQLAIILVDASNGVVKQTKRHARICALMGIKHIVLAVNKMDLVGYDKNIFETIKREFKNFCGDFNLESLEIIPLSATVGDNITTKSKNTPWYTKNTLLGYLEELDTTSKITTESFLMPVQRVCRPNHNFRGFQGEIKEGFVSVGDTIVALPTNETAKVSEIFVGDKSEKEAFSGNPVTIQLDREIDISRGNILVKEDKHHVSSLFVANILWMDSNTLHKGRKYLLKCGTKTILATVMTIKYKIDINTGSHDIADVLHKNEIAHVEISLSENIALDSFEKSKTLGSFILIDRVTNMTSACGVIENTLRRSENVMWQHTDINRNFREEQKEQKAITIWFTGLSGSGKSTLANALEKKLVALSKHTMLLDGDNVRHGLNRDLGFKENDRIENIRRLSEVTKLMNDAGLIVITSFISPYEKDRLMAREIIGDDLLEIYVSTPIEECEKRDVKGLYKKARNGEIPNFTGISSPYEKPRNPFLEVDTSKYSLEEAVNLIFDKIKNLV